MPRSFSGTNLSDAAAFTATFSGLRSLTDGDYRISFDFPGEKFMEVAAILSQGGKPSAAKGTWFAIARLNDGGAATGNNPISQSLQLANHTSERAARSPNPPPQRAALLSERVYIRLCLGPTGRAFVEEFFQDIIQGQKVNDAGFAKAIVKRRLGVESLSEVDSDPVASEQAEQLLNLYAGWERGYVEAPRILKENQA